MILSQRSPNLSPTMTSGLWFVNKNDELIQYIFIIYRDMDSQKFIPARSLLKPPVTAFKNTV